MKEYHSSVPNSHMRNRSSVLAKVVFIRRLILLAMRKNMMLLPKKVNDELDEVQIKMCQVSEI